MNKGVWENGSFPVSSDFLLQCWVIVGDDVADDRKQAGEMFGDCMHNVSTTPTNEKGRWITW